ncbi:MAG: replication initiation factor domain-containing protein [Lachnospiraceae bacterium]|nr:replication initiation factor domain-containing protein [Lachnospiraceae bacterium]
MNNSTLNSQLSLGIDEFTLVLQYMSKVCFLDWCREVDAMIEEFCRLSEIESLLGKLVTMNNKKPAGYTHAVTIADVPYYFCIAWHENYQRMGVCIKFSAYALATYMSAYERQHQQMLTVSDFLQMIQSDMYSTRLSRIDMTVDYKNYGIDLSPDTIYGKLKNLEYRIVNYDMKYTKRKLSSVEKEGTVETFYVGSRGANCNSLLRCYDKKHEQLENHGFRMQEALNCMSWTRFEVSFRGTYAHQITENLLNDVHNPIEMQHLIAQKITEKYLFFDTKTDWITDFSDELLGLVGNSQISYLRKESPRDNSLKQSVQHLLCGSGLFPTLFKVCQIWGEDAEKEFWKYLYDYYQDNYKPEAVRDKELRMWLKKHESTLKQQTLNDSLY